MREAPRILLHNSETSELARRLQAVCPQAEICECNSYAALPPAIDAFQPDIVYSVRFAGSDGFPRRALLGPKGPRWIANGGAGTDDNSSYSQEYEPRSPQQQERRGRSLSASEVTFDDVFIIPNPTYDDTAIRPFFLFCEQLAEPQPNWPILGLVRP